MNRVGWRVPGLILLAACVSLPGRAGAQVQVGYCAPLKDLEATKAAGFDRGRISVEASTTDFAKEAPQAIAFLRGMLAAKP